MAEAFQFELVSPERLLVSEEVESVVIPGAEGEMTVMANHAPVMTTIKPGVVTVNAGFRAGTERYVVFGGFADILPTGCTLLAESAVAVEGHRPGRTRPPHPGAREDVADAKDDQARSKAGGVPAPTDRLWKVRFCRLSSIANRLHRSGRRPALFSSRSVRRSRRRHTPAQPAC